MNSKSSRHSLWQRCLDIVQHICVLTAFVMFIAYVQTVTATEYEYERTIYEITGR